MQIPTEPHYPAEIIYLFSKWNTQRRRMIEIKLPDGKVIARAVLVMDTSTCQHCKQPVMANTAAYALDAPYSCVVHHNCWPYFNYNGQWPYAFPQQAYAPPPQPLPQAPTTCMRM